MNALRTYLLVLFLCLPALAQEGLRVTETSATAQGDVQRPVVVDVTVANQGKETSKPALVIVKFTPKVSSSQRGSGGMMDPLELRQIVGPVEPGQKQVVTFKTPYESASAYKGRRGAFRANNLSPTGEINVEFQARLEGAPSR
ncbi:MAG: hypothetical protein AB1758_08375 [Candidatus Eremiobacterota bacterium]